MSAGNAEKTPAKPQVLLSHHLKQLKLPTFLAEYDKVARECARDGIDHARYLLLELLSVEQILSFWPNWPGERGFFGFLQDKRVPVRANVGEMSRYNAIERRRYPGVAEI